MSSRVAGEPREEKEQEEDFYDCQETLGPQEQGLREEEKTLEEMEEQTQQEAEGSEDLHIKTDSLTDRRDVTEREEEEGGGGGGGTEGEGGREEEEQGDGLQEDLNPEMKEESQEVEFDDDYLREAEKELSEEEKESRRQQSLTLKEKGNSQFKAGDWVEAERSYTEALHLCPVCFSRERAVLFSNRAAARLHLDQKEKAVSDCSRAIDLNPDYVRALLRRAELYEQTDKLDEALEDYKKVLDLDPTQLSARNACMRLPQQIQERNEKLKEEMMSKLKDLGNLVLRPFGLSTNNFQVNQDSDTGSYSINFTQNANNNR